MKFKVISHAEKFEKEFATLAEAQEFVSTNFSEYNGGPVTGMGDNCCCIYRWGGYREGIELYIVKEE